MFLHTMNDDEKTFESFRIINWAKDVHDEYAKIIIEKFSRGTRFPYFNRVLFDDDRGNKWHLLFMCRNKAHAKKGIYATICYSIYNVPRKRNADPKSDTNSGKGIIMFDPVQWSKYMDDQKNNRKPVFMDVVPHMFNQYTKRYLEPLGKADIEFDYKVESMLSRWMHFDVMGDKSSEKHTDKGFAPYDVFMRDGGIMRGQIVTEVLIRFFTYVSEDMLYENQKEWEEKMEHEWRAWIRKGILL